MENMTRKELMKKIRELNAELKKEIKNNGTTKRASFLQATVNLYLKRLEQL